MVDREMMGVSRSCCRCGPDSLGEVSQFICDVLQHFQDHLLWALKVTCLWFTFPDGALLPLLLTADVMLSPSLGYIWLFQQIHMKYFKKILTCLSCALSICLS